MVGDHIKVEGKVTIVLLEKAGRHIRRLVVITVSGKTLTEGPLATDVPSVAVLIDNGVEPF